MDEVGQLKLRPSQCCGVGMIRSSIKGAGEHGFGAWCEAAMAMEVRVALAIVKHCPSAVSAAIWGAEAWMTVELY